MTTPAPQKSRRGRETALDMIRSLGVVMILVVGLWFFGQASKSDEAEIRPYDPVAELKAFTDDHPGAPSVTAPSGWVVNGADYDEGWVRVGFVIDDDQFAEYAGGTGDDWVAEQTAKGKPVGTVDVAGVSWQVLRSTSDKESLVRVVAGQTIVVGGLRETASRESLVELAGQVR